MQNVTFWTCCVFFVYFAYWNNITSTDVILNALVGGKWWPQLYQTRQHNMFYKNVKGKMKHYISHGYVNGVWNMYQNKLFTFG